MQKNENDHFRGLHIVVINSKTGKIETAQVFDTHETSDDFDKFIETGLPKGHIVAAACQDTCTAYLSLTGRLFFANMGSMDIWKLAKWESFAIIAKYG